MLDDLSPLRQWSDSLKPNEVHLFTPAEANHTTFSGSFFGPSGNAGQNPPAGAVIYYYLKTEIKKPEEKKDEKREEGTDEKKSETITNRVAADAPSAVRLRRMPMHRAKPSQTPASKSKSSMPPAK